MDKPLQPINHNDDIKEYQAYSEKKEIVFPHCTHKDIQFLKDRHELVCKCGVAYSGERLNELYETLTKNQA